MGVLCSACVTSQCLGGKEAGDGSGLPGKAQMCPWALGWASRGVPCVTKDGALGPSGPLVVLT